MQEILKVNFFKKQFVNNFVLSFNLRRQFQFGRSRPAQYRGYALYWPRHLFTDLGLQKKIIKMKLPTWDQDVGSSKYFGLTTCGTITFEIYVLQTSWSNP
jgi:hypothetical protein